MSVNIVSFSGGKDSTAMLLIMLEKNIKIDEIVFCDTGVEFPEMYEHIEKIQRYLNRKIVVAHPLHSFKYFMLEFKKKNGQIGYSWPDMKNRWCTQRLKKDVMNKELTKIKRKYKTKDIVQFHGIAVDEKHRTQKNNEKIIKYPLVEWNITEKEALKYCYKFGFFWSGLYKKFDRVSCWCCPLSNKKELNILKIEYPDLWNELEKWDKSTWRKFKTGKQLNQEGVY